MDNKHAIKELEGLVSLRKQVMAAYKRKRNIRPSELAMSLAAEQSRIDALKFAIQNLKGE